VATPGKMALGLAGVLPPANGSSPQAGFLSNRRHAKYCRNACRQAAQYRARHANTTIALVTWGTVIRPGVHRYDASWTFFGSRAAALAAAPRTGEPFSVVDVAAKPRLRLPNIGEIARRTRFVEGDDPYSPTGKGLPEIEVPVNRRPVSTRHSRRNGHCIRPQWPLPRCEAWVSVVGWPRFVTPFVSKTKGGNVSGLSNAAKRAREAQGELVNQSRVGAACRAPPTKGGRSNRRLCKRCLRLPPRGSLKSSLRSRFRRIGSGVIVMNGDTERTRR
jgi:hypothetical protein